ncbi:MAG: chromate transporter, partial [Firmicutes bacterium]|nr:chromate transporter [Bacillota bacterium]
DNFLEIAVVANAFKGIKIAVGILILDAAFTMMKKMQKKKMPRTIMVCSCTAMLLINIFAWNFSSISMMIIAAAISMAIFAVKGPEQKGGEEK